MSELQHGVLILRPSQWNPTAQVHSAKHGATAAVPRRSRVGDRQGTHGVPCTPHMRRLHGVGGFSGGGGRWQAFGAKADVPSGRGTVDMLVAGAPLELERHPHERVWRKPREHCAHMWQCGPTGRRRCWLGCHWAPLVFVRIIANYGSVLRDFAASAAELRCVRSCTQGRHVWTTPR